MVKHYEPADTGIDVSYGFHFGPHHFVKPSFDLHTHGFMEMVLVLGGQGTHLTSYGDYQIQAGDVFVIYGDTAHGFAESAGMDIVNFMFTESYLEETSRWLRQLPGYHSLFYLEPVYRHRHEARNRLRLSASELKRVKRIVERLDQENSARDPGYRAALTGQWVQLLTFLCRSFSNIDSVPFSPLADTLAYIEEHFAEDLSLDALADRAHYSKNQFIRVFKQHYNMTPNKYVNQVRIDHAKDLLLHSDKNMTEIALDSGFGDSNYFSRMFKQCENMSPMQFRKDRLLEF